MELARKLQTKPASSVALVGASSEVELGLPDDARTTSAEPVRQVSIDDVGGAPQFRPA